jgi:hypothetical protein
VLAAQGQQQLNVSETNPTIYIQCFIAIHKMLTGPPEIGYARHRPAVPMQLKTCISKQCLYQIHFVRIILGLLVLKADKGERHNVNPRIIVD